MTHPGRLWLKRLGFPRMELSTILTDYKKPVDSAASAPTKAVTGKLLRRAQGSPRKRKTADDA